MRRQSLLPAASPAADSDPPGYPPARKRGNEEKTGKDKDGLTSKAPARRKSGTRKSAASELSSVSLASISPYHQSDEGDEPPSAGNSACATGTCSASDSASLQGVVSSCQGPAAAAAAIVAAAAAAAADGPPRDEANNRDQERVDQARRARRGREAGRESLGNAGGSGGGGGSRQQTKTRGHEAAAEMRSSKAMDDAAPAAGAVSDDASVGQPAADHDGLEQTVAQMLNAVQVGRELAHLNPPCILDCMCLWLCLDIAERPSERFVCMCRRWRKAEWKAQGGKAFVWS